MENEMESIKELWKHALQDYSQVGLEDRLKQRWPNDPNVMHHISYQYPPTFQPGYVGCDYWSQTQRLLILSQNPGEGADPVSQARDVHYSDVLKRFVDSLLSWEELNREVASEMLRWRTFAEKGIFAESGASRISLLHASVRPSIHGIAYLNAFPFKTVGNRKPTSSPFRTHVWETFVSQAIQLLAPMLIVRFPESDDLAPTLCTNPSIKEVVRAWHPSDYNVNTRPGQLVEHWIPVNAFLAGNSSHASRPPSVAASPSQNNQVPQKTEFQHTPTATALDSTLEAFSLRKQRAGGELLIEATPATPTMYQLDVYWNDKHIGQYERSNSREVQRKILEIQGAFRLLLDVYEKHGEWVVRWDGQARQKSIRVNGREVGIIPKDYWGRPSWIG
jgi:hypothetical protein